MKLKRFLLRYYPPGIILEYEQGEDELTKPIDLLGLTPDTDIDVLLNQIIRQEPLLSEKRKPQLEKLVNKLIDKLEENADQSFYLFKILRAHILPLTNCAFNKSGDRFITGSYDRTVSRGRRPRAHIACVPSRLPPTRAPSLFVSVSAKRMRTAPAEDPPPGAARRARPD
jgi:antitoxin component of RelBE/YafQ-DinJ toxin-antitoxin module